MKENVDEDLKQARLSIPTGEARRSFSTTPRGSMSARRSVGARTMGSTGMPDDQE
jgi:hypothetical protein